MSVVTFADHASKNKQKTMSPPVTSKFEVTLPTASVRAHHLAALMSSEAVAKTLSQSCHEFNLC
jgi:hypothetical protein